MKLLYKRIVFLLVTIGYMSLIWIQSSWFNPEELGELTSLLNQFVFLFIGATLEFAHLFQFGLLYLCIVLVFLSFGSLQSWQELTAVFIALAYGVVDEVHQLYVPFRSFSVVDLIKDALGVWVFWLVVHKSYFVNSKSKIGHWLRSI